jgi:methylenetetrahydrofolate reductase (NADPH)
MTKIIDKITCRREKKWSDGGTPLYVSLEFFPPKTKAGLDNLYTRIDRMVQRLDPLFVDVTWGAGGNTSDKTMAVAAYAQKQHGHVVEVLMHLTTTGMSRDAIIKALNQAKSFGIQNILALRGDPPLGQRRWKVGDMSDGYCSRAIDLVKLIREVHGDYFGIAVVSIVGKRKEWMAQAPYIDCKSYNLLYCSLNRPGIQKVIRHLQLRRTN